MKRQALRYYHYPVSLKLNIFFKLSFDLIGSLVMIVSFGSIVITSNSVITARWVTTGRTGAHADWDQDNYGCAQSG